MILSSGCIYAGYQCKYMFFHLILNISFIQLNIFLVATSALSYLGGEKTKDPVANAILLTITRMHILYGSKHYQ